MTKTWAELKCLKHVSECAVAVKCEGMAEFDIFYYQDCNKDMYTHTLYFSKHFMYSACYMRMHSVSGKYFNLKLFTLCAAIRCPTKTLNQSFLAQLNIICTQFSVLMWTEHLGMKSKQLSEFLEVSFLGFFLDGGSHDSVRKIQFWLYMFFKKP